MKEAEEKRSEETGCKSFDGSGIAKLLVGTPLEQLDELMVRRGAGGWRHSMRTEADGDGSL